MPEARGVVGPGRVLRVIGDFTPAVVALDLRVHKVTYLEVHSYFFGAASPIVNAESF
jgi:hypothetical protein